MAVDIENLVTKDIAALYKFRSAYLTAMNRFAKRRLGKVNVAELAVVTARRGSRLPSWLDEVSDSLASELPLLHDLQESSLIALYLSIRADLLRHKVLPKTKVDLLAAYLVGEVCATADSIMQFASISKSTAHKWLRSCVKLQILDDFETQREIYYLHPNLLQLALIGHMDPKSLFRGEYLKDLNSLRNKKRTWLALSRLVVRFGRDSRWYDLA